MNNSTTLAVVNGVNFTQSGDLIIATAMAQTDFLCISEVKQAAKLAALPSTGWQRSEYTESYLLKTA